MSGTATATADLTLGGTVDVAGTIDYTYDITVHNTGSTTIGTFWFSWVPGAGFLNTPALSATHPTNWAANFTDANEAIQWVANTSGADIPAGGTLSGFTFTTTESPAQLALISNTPDPTHPPPNNHVSQLTTVVYTGGPFSDNGFTFAVNDLACFAAGTQILTARGLVPVEALEIGDHVATLRGAGLSRVTWLGHRRVDCRHHPRPETVWPIRISRGAFAPGVPQRDLLLSPDHAVYASDRLIPVRYLVNGATIRREPMDTVTYWHVELPRHDVLLAEGLPCESYLDTGNRGAFANGGPATAMHPDFALRIWDSAACAELVITGPALAAVKSHLLRRAAILSHDAEADPRLHLLIDGATIPGETNGNTIRFNLPAGTQTARLVSRSAAPAEMFGESEDHRHLGVAIAEIRLDGTPATPSGEGWHKPDATGLRWTDGNATLHCDGARCLELTLAPILRYWPEQRETIAARA